MGPLFLYSPTIAPAPSSADSEIAGLSQRISALYALSQTNPHVFASPVGPFAFRRRSVWLPRFVFFGPHAADDSWRLAFLGSFDHRDLRPTHALLNVVETLAQDAENGHGLNLTFFPLVDAAGLALRAKHRELAYDSWSCPGATEIALLSRDVRTRGYHGFVRVEAAAPGDDSVSLRVRAPAGFVASAPDVEVISSAELAPLEVRFEHEVFERGRSFGPLELAEDLGVQPFELTVRVPSTWSRSQFESTVAHVLVRFVHHYRAFHAFGGEL